MCEADSNTSQKKPQTRSALETDFVNIVHEYDVASDVAAKYPEHHLGVAKRVAIAMHMATKPRVRSHD